MTWGGQVRVMLAKDVRHVWWMLTILAVALTLTAWRMTVAQPEIGSSFGFFDTLIPVAIVWIVLAVIRADPPATSTAFWATQPLETSAVAVAKLLQAMIAGSMVLGGVTLILRWWGIAWSDVPSTVMVTAIGSSTLSIVTAVFAIVGSNVRGVITGLVLTATGLFALFQWLPVSSWQLSADVARTLWMLLVVADLFILLRLYRRREMSVTWQTAGLIGGVGTLFCAFAAAKAPPYAMTPGIVAPALTLSVDPIPGTIKPFAVTLDGLVTPAERVEIRDATIRIELPDGSRRVLPVLGTETRYLSVAQSRSGDPKPEVSEGRQQRLRAISPLNIADWLRLRVPGARVTFDGTIVEFERKERHRVPLVSAVLPPTLPGAREKLQMVVGDSTLLAVYTSRVFIDQRTWTAPETVDAQRFQKFLLVNRFTDAVGEDLSMSSHGGPAVLALPGIRITDERAELQPPWRLLKSATDTSWWSSHEIVITTLEARRVYRVHAETVLGR